MPTKTEQDCHKCAAGDESLNTEPCSSCRLTHRGGKEVFTGFKPHIMPSGFKTRYEANRDPFYGLERDPVTGRARDCRDRD